MGDELNELYQQVILDHCRKPRHFHALPEANRTAEGNNPLCGDHFTVFLKLEGDVIQDISFQGSGCCISKASASMMTDQLKGKTVADARKVFSSIPRHGDHRRRGRGGAWASCAPLPAFITFQCASNAPYYRGTPCSPP